jgi:hypothetical protein
MKKFILGSALALSISTLVGQDATNVVSDVFAPRRIVKTNLLGYALLAVNANYEQKVGLKTSVGLLGGYKIPSVVHLDAIGKLDGENQTYSGDIEPAGLFLNPYFRFYTGEKVFKGFYLEAFTRYYDYTFLVPYDYDKDGEIIHANLDGTASGFGGGLALGVQVPLGLRWYLDINLGYGMASGDAHVETNDPKLDAEDYQTIKRNIEKYRDDADVKVFLMDDVISGIEANASSNSAWADITGKTFPLVRGGIAIGFAF